MTTKAKQVSAAKDALDRQRGRGKPTCNYEAINHEPKRKPDLLRLLQDQVMDELSITSDLPTEFAKQAAYFAHYAFLHARAMDFVRELEEQVEVSFYELYDEYRGGHSDAKENECKSFVRTHAKHQRLTQGLRAGQFQSDVMKATVRAFEMRKDMLVQLGAQYRAEMDGTDLKTSVRKATKIVKDSYHGKKERHATQEET